MAKQQLIQSAEFKRDYIAFGAVAIFFLIVGAEIALAVNIPLYLSRENSMAFQVERLRLFRTFDDLRRQAGKINLRQENTAAELRLLNDALNQLAGYLRTHRNQLNLAEIRRLQQFTDDAFRAVQKIKNGGFCRENKLDCASYLDSFIPDRPQTMEK